MESRPLDTERWMPGKLQVREWWRCLSCLGGGFVSSPLASDIHCAKPESSVSHHEHATRKLLGARDPMQAATLVALAVGSGKADGQLPTDTDSCRPAPIERGFIGLWLLTQSVLASAFTPSRVAGNGASAAETNPASQRFVVTALPD